MPKVSTSLVKFFEAGFLLLIMFALLGPIIEFNFILKASSLMAVGYRSDEIAENTTINQIHKIDSISTSYNLSEVILKTANEETLKWASSTSSDNLNLKNSGEVQSNVVNSEQDNLTALNLYSNNVKNSNVISSDLMNLKSLNAAGSNNLTSDANVGSKSKNSGQNFTPILLWWTKEHVGTSFHGMTTTELFSHCGGKCIFTDDRTFVNKSHAVFFYAWSSALRSETSIVNGTNTTKLIDMPQNRHENQFYIYYFIEAPVRYHLDIPTFQFFFNWTMSYRLDSDFINTYGRIKENSAEEVRRFKITSAVKSGLRNRSIVPVAGMVSNCKKAPSNRTWLVDEIKRFIPVDIYGECGNKSCNFSRAQCYPILAKQHKFYLAFENSLCLDYVTEKFFFALQAGMVPIVYGEGNYGLQYPHGSFINVDSFASAQGLAEYLKYLNSNDEEYLKYFRWRKYYHLENRHISRLNNFCRVCERVLKEYNSGGTSIVDLEQWLLKPDSEAKVCKDPPEEF